MRGDDQLGVADGEYGFDVAHSVAVEPEVAALGAAILVRKAPSSARMAATSYATPVSASAIGNVKRNDHARPGFFGRGTSAQPLEAEPVRQACVDRSILGGRRGVLSARDTPRDLRLGRGQRHRRGWYFW